MQNEQPEAENQPRSFAKRRINVLGLIFLIAGSILIIYNVYFYIKRKKEFSLKQQNIDSLAKQLDTASAHFEIGYGEMEISLYQKMKSAAEEKESNLLVYPIVKNEIDQLISSGAIHPGYEKIAGDDGFLKEFIPLYKKKKLKLFSTGVVCLIVKQIGKGKAENVKLDVNHLILNGAHDMFDPTDIAFGIDSNLTGKDRINYHVSLQPIDLGTMDTGAAWLVPLYISNGFDRLDRGTDPTSWTITAGPILVPLTLSYSKKGRPVKPIPLDKVLTRPIDISQ